MSFDQFVLADFRLPATLRRVQSLLSESGELSIRVATMPVPSPKDGEVIVRMEAAPINPSDIGQLFGVADLDSIRNEGVGGENVLTVHASTLAVAAMERRIGVPVPVGNEGAGTVVQTGSAPEARALLGKTVAVMSGGTYATFCCAQAENCIELPAGTTAAEGASSFVNPLTALGFVETARREGRAALVHTAAASNLGRMLNRVCLQDDLKLVNIVRSAAQAALLRGEGAQWVIDSSQPDFLRSLTDALAATGATLAFDAVGGGQLASDVLTCMERAINRNAQDFNRYGSATQKHVYVYGGLNTATIELRQDFGKAWSLAGWLLTNFLQQTPPHRVKELKMRIAGQIKSTFASSYGQTLSLAQVLQADQVRSYTRRATGQKFLVCPLRE